MKPVGGDSLEMVGHSRMNKGKIEESTLNSANPGVAVPPLNLQMINDNNNDDDDESIGVDLTPRLTPVQSAWGAEFDSNDLVNNNKNKNAAEFLDNRSLPRPSHKERPPAQAGEDDFAPFEMDYDSSAAEVMRKR